MNKLLGVLSLCFILLGYLPPLEAAATERPTQKDSHQKERLTGLVQVKGLSSGFMTVRVCGPSTVFYDDLCPFNDIIPSALADDNQPKTTTFKINIPPNQKLLSVTYQPVFDIQSLSNFRDIHVNVEDRSTLSVAAVSMVRSTGVVYIRLTWLAIEE